MLKRISAALIVASLFGAPALAASPTATDPATQTTTTKVVKVAKHKRHLALHHKRIKHVRHFGKHTKHTAHLRHVKHAKVSLKPVPAQTTEKPATEK